MLEVRTYATLAEAAGAMDASARFMGGGTLVMRDVNYGSQDFAAIIRVTDREFRRIRTEGGRVVIGAGATMTDVMLSRETDFLAPAARAVGGPAIRNMATVGGNLCAPHPYGDLATALLALDAHVRIVGGGEQPLDQFLLNRRGLIEAVAVQRPAGDVFRFRKVSRVKPKGVSVMCIAACLNRGAGRLSGVRIAYGAMGPAPQRALRAEQALEGRTLDLAGIQPALAVATDGLDPPTDALASTWYRREVAPVHLRRLLLGETR